MRKALCVGINYYDFVSSLEGCVNDANDVANVLERNYDGSKNFDVNMITAFDVNSQITRKNLRNAIDDLFSDNPEIALFYFSGHGYIESTGGYLITSECKEGDDGLPLSDLLTIASHSKAKNKIIILDSCYSGVMGNLNQFDEFSLICEGMTILTACEKNQYSIESEKHGVFTSLLVGALLGGAMNLLGEVTPGSVYAYIDQSLGAFQQRPLFKTNIKNFVSLRKCKPPVKLQELHKLTSLFLNRDEEFKLDSSYEPTSLERNDEHCEKFAVLQRFNHVNLVVPVGVEHMYYAAIENKSCKLTPLGIHYWNLVKNKRI